MLSNFGRADGGRETWAYNFIPRLLARFPDLRLDIIGLRVDGQPDNCETLLTAVPKQDRGRLSVQFVSTVPDAWPNALSYWRGVPALAQSSPTPNFVLAVGSWVELRAALKSPSFRPSKKIAWLRSIFADEKAHRYPSVLRPFIEWMELAILRQADLIVANGEDTAAHYRGLGLPVTVIPNAIDVDHWKLPARALEPPLQVAYVGRLAAVKGLSEFLQVASMAEKEGALDRFEFHVVGDGGDRELTEVKKLPWIQYHGAMGNDTVRDFLARTDVCVGLTFVSSKPGKIGGGGISHALLEQAAAGRVMVCWDNAIYRQVLDERSAYMVKQGSAPALWQALKQIATDPQLALTKSRAASVTVRRFGLDEHVQLFEQTIDYLMECPVVRS